MRLISFPRILVAISLLIYISSKKGSLDLDYGFHAIGWPDYFILVNTIGILLFEEIVWLLGHLFHFAYFFALVAGEVILEIYKWLISPAVKEYKNKEENYKQVIRWYQKRLDGQELTNPYEKLVQEVIRETNEEMDRAVLIRKKQLEKEYDDLNYRLAASRTYYSAEHRTQSDFRSMK